MLHPTYTLKDNFITQNTYMCIELNAHTLITFLLTIRDNFLNLEGCFRLWLLGSQSCKKIFRSARSMTNMFSTMINFGMLGLLRRLHRLQIQAKLQAESNATGIVYPRAKKHKIKDGDGTYITPFLSDIKDTISQRPLSELKSEPKHHQKHLKKKLHSKRNPFVEVVVGDPKRSALIRKTTAIWLFQEGERVSSDRIFRVRSKQPHNSENVKEMLSNDSKSDDALPTVSKILKLGDLCVFQMQDGNEWCIGRVLQFAKLKGKNVGHQQCKEWSVDLSTKNHRCVMYVV